LVKAPTPALRTYKCLATEAHLTENQSISSGANSLKQPPLTTSFHAGTLSLPVLFLSFLNHINHLLTVGKVVKVYFFKKAANALTNCC